MKFCTYSEFVWMTWRYHFQINQKQILSPLSTSHQKYSFPCLGGEASLLIKGCSADEKSLRPVCLVISRQIQSVLTLTELFLTSNGSFPHASWNKAERRGRGTTPCIHSPPSRPPMQKTFKPTWYYPNMTSPVEIKKVRKCLTPPPAIGNSKVFIFNLDFVPCHITHFDRKPSISKMTPIDLKW